MLPRFSGHQNRDSACMTPPCQLINSTARTQAPLAALLRDGTSASGVYFHQKNRLPILRAAWLAKSSGEEGKLIAELTAGSAAWKRWGRVWPPAPESLPACWSSGECQRADFPPGPW